MLHTIKIRLYLVTIYNVVTSEKFLPEREDLDSSRVTARGAYQLRVNFATSIELGKI